MCRTCILVRLLLSPNSPLDSYFNPQSEVHFINIYKNDLSDESCLKIVYEKFKMSFHKDTFRFWTTTHVARSSTELSPSIGKTGIHLSLVYLRHNFIEEINKCNWGNLINKNTCWVG